MTARCPAVTLCLAAVATSALGATYSVGTGKTYATLSALPSLAPGDLVEVSAGTYPEVRRWTASGTAAAPITIRGLGSPPPLFDATGLTVDGSLPNPRAVFQVEGAHVVLENFELVNARNGDNGAGVRVTGAAADGVVLRGLKIHDCDMGIMSDGADHLLVDASEVYENGTASYSGYSHNLYLGGQGTTVQFSYIHDSLFGQNVKSRGHFTALLYNFIADSEDGEVGLVDEAETATPDSNAVMIGNVVVAKPRNSGFNTGRFIWFGQDLGGAHTGTLYVFNNTFVAGDARINFLEANATGAAVVASNNVFFASDSLVTGSGAVSGTKNCVPDTATIPSGLIAAVTAAAAPFADAAGRDFHLTATTPCRNAGTPGLTYVDGTGASQSGAPTFQYVNHLASEARASDGQLDLGAYEYVTGSPPDAGATGDAGAATDAGTADAGQGADAGTGPAVDGGTGSGGPEEAPVAGGCGCAAQPGDAFAGWLMVAVAALERMLARRRRQLPAQGAW